jgi:hypothetical protein
MRDIFPVTSTVHDCKSGNGKRSIPENIHFVGDHEKSEWVTRTCTRTPIAFFRDIGAFYQLQNGRTAKLILE